MRYEKDMPRCLAMSKRRQEGEYYSRVVFDQIHCIMWDRVGSRQVHRIRKIELVETCIIARRVDHRAKLCLRNRWWLSRDREVDGRPYIIEDLLDARKIIDRGPHWHC